MFFGGKRGMCDEKKADTEQKKGDDAGRRMRIASGKLQTKEPEGRFDQALQGFVCAVQKVFFA
jgi:hypothetical protein